MGRKQERQHTDSSHRGERVRRNDAAVRLLHPHGSERSAGAALRVPREDEPAVKRWVVAPPLRGQNGAHDGASNGPVTCVRVCSQRITRRLRTSLFSADEGVAFDVV